MELSDLRKRGNFRVELGGEEKTAPFSGRKSVWHGWIYLESGRSWDECHVVGESEGDLVLVKSDSFSMEVPVDRLNPYLAPAFEGGAVVKNRNVLVREYCLEPARSYHARVEQFSFRLPPTRFFPFIGKRRTLFLLALSAEPFQLGDPVHPLVPIFQGRTG